MNTNLENAHPTIKAKKGPHSLAGETKHVKPATINKAHKPPFSANKTTDSRAALEYPEFEYEYLQEKLYLEEIFNTLYLSFDNPTQPGNAAQYMQLLQQERMLLDSMQQKPLQAGMAFEDQSETAAFGGDNVEAALVQQMELEAENAVALAEAQKQSESKKEAPAIVEESVKSEEVKDRQETIEPGLSAVLKQKQEAKKKGKNPDSNTKVLRSIYLSFPVKKSVNKNVAGGAIGTALPSKPVKTGIPQKEHPGVTEEKEFANGSYYKGGWMKGQPNGDGMLISCMGFMYQGRFRDGKFHGYGEKQMPNGVLYKGYWSNGQMEGKAKLTFPDGDIYLGTFKDNKFEGEGIRRFPNGDMFRGQYHDGYQHGYGVFISMEEGWKYIGQWNKGKIHGKGLCIWVDGTVYDGDWANWIKEGQGVLELSDKTSYKGEFKHDFPNGKGVKIFPDGSEYLGEFVNGQFSGYGTFRWSDGTVYEGHWQNNKISGEGTHTMPDGTSITGFFIGKKTVSGKGTKVWRKGGKEFVYKGAITNGTIDTKGTFEFPDGRTYTGDCIDGTMQGTGKYTWTDPHSGTANYSGDFQNNQFHGKGVLLWTSGDKYIGDFQHGVYAGMGVMTAESRKFHYSGQLKNGKAHGKGKLKTEHMTYEGEFVEGEIQGEGHAVFTTGDTYTGSFYKSKFHGYGHYKYTDGLEISGYFVNGKCGKYGKKVFADGRVYIGEMNYDVPHGRGMMIKSNGSARYGRWEKGIYQKTAGKVTERMGENFEEEDKGMQGGNGSEEKLVFPAYTVEGNLFAGATQVEYSNGDVYLGYLREGLKNGKGIYMKKDGAEYKGDWENDKPGFNSDLQLEEYNIPLMVKRVEEAEVEARIN